MTCYNREQYIGTAIESVLAQSFQDWELIVVDDQSTDRSLAVAQGYADRDVRIRVYRNDRNLGDYPNRNRAASYARGKYLKYVDSDDAIYPHCLEVMVHMMEHHPEAALLLCTWSPKDPYYPFVLTPLEAYRRHFVHGETMSNSPLTSMYCRYRFEEVGRFNTGFRLCGDYDMVLQLGARFPVIVGPNGLCFYRVHSGQVRATESDSYARHFSEGIQVRLHHLRHPVCPLPIQERRRAVGQSLRLGLRYAVGLAIKKRRPLDAVRVLRSLHVAAGDVPSIARKGTIVPWASRCSRPDWDGFPGARVQLTVSPPPRPVRVSVILPLQTSQDDVTTTIESVLVQSIEAFELLICTAEGDHPAIQRYASDARLRVLGAPPGSTHLEMVNLAASEAEGALLKFLRPPAFLYPAALEFAAHSLTRHADTDVVLESNPGSCLPLPCRLTRDEALLQGLLGRARLFSICLSNATIRRDAFLRIGGFNGAWDEYALFELLVRCAAQHGCVVGLPCLTSEWNRGCVDLAAVPTALRRRLASRIREQGKCCAGNQSLLERVAEHLDSSAPLGAGDVEPLPCPAGPFDWSEYPWSSSPGDQPR